MSVQVKGDIEETPDQAGEPETRRRLATALYMRQIEGIARSGYPDDQKISYVRLALYNWRSRMQQIDAGLY